MPIRIAVWFVVIALVAFGGCLDSAPQPDVDDVVRLPRVSAANESIDSSRAALAFRSSGSSGETYYARTDRQEVTVHDGALRIVPLNTDGGVAGASLQLTTASIRRGNRELGLDAPVISTDHEGRLAIDHRDAVEVFENRADGIEQSWRFAEKPVGRGDLVVTLRVNRYAEEESSSSGLHFRDANGAGIRYSNAIWSDSNGRAWNVSSRWNEGTIVLRVPDSVLERSVFPALLDPLISNDTDVDSAYFARKFGAGSREPSISAPRVDGAHLVVWTDDRMLPETDIYSALIDERGVVWGAIRNGNLQVSDTRGAEGEPVVALINQPTEHWLVAWATETGDIAAATVGIGSAVVQLGSIANTSAEERAPAITASGDDALIVWQAGNDIRGALFAGGAFGPAFDIAATGAIEANPSVARSDDPVAPFLVVWEEGSANQANIRGQRVTTSSTLSGPSFDIAVDTGSQIEPIAVRRSIDDTFVVAWRHRRDIRATRITPEGVVLDQTGGVGGVVIAGGSTVKSNPAVACDLTACLVSWEDERDLLNRTHGLYGQRFSHTGTLLGSEIIISDGVRDQIHPAIAARTGSGFRAVWETHLVGEPIVVFSGISANGVVGSPDGNLVPRSGKDTQRFPTYARGPTSQLAVYADFLSESGAGSSRARRFDANGRALDDDGFGIWCCGGRSGPSVDFDGAQYLSVFSRLASTGPSSSTYDIGARRITEAGELLDPIGIEISAEAGDELFPDVASSGEVSVVTWEDRRATASSGTDIRAAIVTPDGTIAVSDIAICLAAGDQERPAVAWDPTGGVFVVAWSDRRDGDADIYAARMAPDGSVLDPGGVLVGGRPNQQLRPAIATSGGQLLLAWEDHRAAPNRGIHGSRLATSGALSVLDPAGIPISTGSSNKTAPTVVGVKGERWSVAWTDDVNDSVSGLDIRGQTVLSSGGLEGPEFVIAAQPVDESEPSFQAGVNSGKRVYLVYQRPRFDPLEMRVARRFLTY